MFLQRLPFARTAAGVMMALAFTMAPAYAAHGGGGGGGHGGGGHGGGGGGYHGGGYGGGGYGRGGYGGGYGGYGRGGYGGYGRGFGYGNGFGGFGLGYGLGYYGGGYGYDNYPSYDTTYSGYYNPDVQYAQPTLNVTPSVNYDQGAADTRAHITVQVPDPSAQVFFDGDATRQRGTDRVFVTPPLAPGGSFHYTIEAKWMENGQEVNKTRTITVNPGGSATIIF